MPAAQDSESLLERAASGDGVAMGRLIERHLPGLRAFIRLRMGALIRDRESSLDLVHSVCREVLEHADQLQHGGELGFKRWLYRSALRKIADRAAYWRAQCRDVAREERLGSGQHDAGELLAAYRTVCTPSRAAAAEEQVERIEAAFAMLPEHYREAILGVRVLGLSYAELGQQMGRSEGSVRMLICRATARLAELLGA